MTRIAGITPGEPEPEDRARERQVRVDYRSNLVRAALRGLLPILDQGKGFGH